MSSSIPRACMKTLPSFLMENGFRRGTIDKKLFIKKKKSDIVFVQVYVYDIIFGSTKKSMCTKFEDCMHKRFQMSSMGELTFFLVLQVKQQPDGIFIRQETTIVANSTTEAEYVAAANCCGQSKANGLGKDFPNPFMAGSLPKTIKQSNDPPLSRGYTLGSGEDSLELMELMENCFAEIIYFLILSHIYYALTKNPIIFVSLIEQFWETVVLSTTEEGLQTISATIDGHEKLITKDSLRRHLKFDDAEGISSLSNEEIFEHLAHMGYVTNSESLTFFKGHFSPQWKFFIHTILHCLSSKMTRMGVTCYNTYLS
ncbi:putative ribonuclease H-like domain-containing protein [Tanacetum coccineum]